MTESFLLTAADKLYNLVICTDTSGVPRGAVSTRSASHTGAAGASSGQFFFSTLSGSKFPSFMNLR